MTRRLAAALLLLVATGCNESKPPATSTTPLGGQWRLQTKQVLPESSHSNSELWYGGERVAVVVHAHRYYGDDCLAYSAASNGDERSFFVCGTHAPFVLGPESRATWSFEDAALQQQGIEISATAIDKGSQRITVEDAKRRALEQPERAKERRSP